MIEYKELISNIDLNLMERFILKKMDQKYIFLDKNCTFGYFK